MKLGRRDKRFLTILVVVIGALYCFALTNREPAPTTATTTTTSETTQRRFGTLDAQVGCKNLVKNVLKAPRTAKFGHIRVSRGDDLWAFPPNDGYLYASGYVDAENSFGAMLRNDFICGFSASTGDVVYFEFADQIVLDSR